MLGRQSEDSLSLAINSAPGAKVSVGQRRKNKSQPDSRSTSRKTLGVTERLKSRNSHREFSLNRRERIDRYLELNHRYSLSFYFRESCRVYWEQL